MNERIKELRKELNLTLEKFGERLGIQKATLSKIENGTVSITERNIAAICREVNVNENWLRTGEGD
ncbi:MAG: helix-turn-helix domain-containing protein, partial [Lachnospiraceae bacterium]|nr:helix-turn-helix domain-containing protein [Lachnospiraceae bacterium]